MCALTLVTGESLSREVFAQKQTGLLSTVPAWFRLEGRPRPLLRRGLGLSRGQAGRGAPAGDSCPGWDLSTPGQAARPPLSVASVVRGTRCAPWSPLPGSRGGVMPATQRSSAERNRSGYILEVAEPVLELWRGLGASAPRPSPQLGSRRSFRHACDIPVRDVAYVSVGTLGEKKTPSRVSTPETVRFFLADAEFCI